jgi:hypothetical protein
MGLFLVSTKPGQAQKLPETPGTVPELAGSFRGGLEDSEGTRSEVELFSWLHCGIPFVSRLFSSLSPGLRSGWRGRFASARNEEGFQSAYPAFEELVASYRFLTDEVVIKGQGDPPKPETP